MASKPVQAVSKPAAVAKPMVTSKPAVASKPTGVSKAAVKKSLLQGVKPDCNIPMRVYVIAGVLNLALLYFIYWKLNESENTGDDNIEEFSCGCGTTTPTSISAYTPQEEEYEYQKQGCGCSGH